MASGVSGVSGMLESVGNAYSKATACACLTARTRRYARAKMKTGEAKMSVRCADAVGLERRKGQGEVGQRRRGRGSRDWQGRSGRGHQTVRRKHTQHWQKRRGIGPQLPDLSLTRPDTVVYIRRLNPRWWTFWVDLFLFYLFFI